MRSPSRYECRRDSAGLPGAVVRRRFSARRHPACAFFPRDRVQPKPFFAQLTVLGALLSKSSLPGKSRPCARMGVQTTDATPLRDVSTRQMQPFPHLPYTVPLKITPRLHKKMKPVLQAPGGSWRGSPVVEALSFASLQRCICRLRSAIIAATAPSPNLARLLADGRRECSTYVRSKARNSTTLAPVWGKRPLGRGAEFTAMYAETFGHRCARANEGQQSVEVKS